MFTLDHVHEIDATAETVWAVLTDFPAYGEWNPFIPEARCDLRVGGAIEMRVCLGGASPRFQREWVVDLEPGHLFGYGMKPFPLGTLRSHRVHRIEPLGERRCRYHSHFEIHGWLEGLVLKLYRPAFERGFGEMSAAVKARAEALDAKSSRAFDEHG
jgi:hypothetical protein